jgi:hypothetical protein
MIHCEICNNLFPDYRKLSKHIRDNHAIKIKEYYDTYVKHDNEGICQICGNQTAYVNISKGYFNTCSNKACKSSLMKEIRYKNSLDDEKHRQFVQKVSANQSRIWANRTETGEDKAIREKIGSTLSYINSMLSKTELKEKYGWLNNLSDEEKEKWKTEVMFNTGAHRFWKNATIEDKHEVMLKRMGTLFDNTKIMIENYNNTKQWDDYNNSVRYLTEINYQRYIDDIDPKRLRSNDFHLDHMFSVKAGFLLNIAPEIISSKYNLKVISKKENLSKSVKCDITIEHLMEKYTNGQ